MSMKAITAQPADHSTFGDSREIDLARDFHLFMGLSGLDPWKDAQLDAFVEASGRIFAPVLWPRMSAGYSGLRGYIFPVGNQDGAMMVVFPRCHDWARLDDSQSDSMISLHATEGVTTEQIQQVLEDLKKTISNMPSLRELDGAV